MKELLDPISWLAGTWRGKGAVSFPTLKSFEFEDRMHFKFIKNAYHEEPLIHFEEIAWIYDNQKKCFKHWESGFFKPTYDGRIQLYLCHNTGRIEVTFGNFNTINTEEQSFEITFESDFIRNDQGTKIVVSSQRRLIFENGILEYSLAMSTVEVPSTSSHLKVYLEKSIDNK